MITTEKYKDSQEITTKIANKYLQYHNQNDVAAELILHSEYTKKYPAIDLLRMIADAMEEIEKAQKSLSQ